MKRRIGLIATAIWLGVMGMAQTGFPKQFTVSGDATYDLAKERSRETQYYIHTEEMVRYAPDGSRAGSDICRVYLKAEPVTASGKKTFKYTCVRVVIQPNGAKETSLPSLTNWKHIPMIGIDDKNRTFGIDHAPFLNLVDSDGNALRFDKSYQVYNTFIDFHAFTSVFADPVSGGSGIQDLHRVGEKIVHASAFSSAPVHLEGNISEGSYFKNGKTTLEFKGLSVVNGRPCALMGADSGESSFKMIVSPMPNMTLTTVGGSHYKGDIYRDLVSGWVQKVAFDELVVIETTIPVPNAPVVEHSTVERNVLIINVSKDEFMRQQLNQPMERK